jgi:hypothetical protein
MPNKNSGNPLAQIYTTAKIFNSFKNRTRKKSVLSSINLHRPVNTRKKSNSDNSSIRAHHSQEEEDQEGEDASNSQSEDSMLVKNNIEDCKIEIDNNKIKNYTDFFYYGFSTGLSKFITKKTFILDFNKAKPTIISMFSDCSEKNVNSMQKFIHDYKTCIKDFNEDKKKFHTIKFENFHYSFNVMNIILVFVSKLMDDSGMKIIIDYTGKENDRDRDFITSKFEGRFNIEINYVQSKSGGKKHKKKDKHILKNIKKTKKNI